MTTTDVIGSKPTVRDDAERLTEVLEDLLRVVQFRDRDRACCYDISVSQCYALERVVDAEALTVNELAAGLYLDKSTASRIANSLVQKGYVVRERDAEDGRVVRLVPTVEGSALCERILGDIVNEYEELLGDFHPDVRTSVIELIGRLGQSFAARVEASGGSCCVVK
ncbi:MAG: MarR family transcriptional regulator [Gemmatimonadota bacterium]|jgi:DNA-binding MarR family transcriptional regulator